MAKRAAQLEALSPLSVLSRGYAMVSDTDGNMITNAASLKVGDAVDLRFSDGSARAEITKINTEKS